MKSFLNKTTQTTIAVLTGILVASHAFAWTAPVTPAFNNNVPAPVNTGTVAQTKGSDFSVLGNLWAKVNPANPTVGGNIFAGYGWIANNLLAGKSRIGCSLNCSATTVASTNVLEAGKFDSGNLSTGLVASTLGTVSVKGTTLFSNLMGLTGSLGRNALHVLVSNDNLTGTAGAVIQTNADKFSFFNSAGTAKVGIAANHVDTNGIRVAAAGTAQPGKVLTAMNTAGDAIWADANTSGTTYTTTTIQSLGLDNVKVIRRTWENDNNTRIHDGYALCEPGYMAISGGVDCEPAGISPSDPASHGKHDVSISEPSSGSGSYAYGSGSGNSTVSSQYPTGWHGACGNRNSSNSSLDMHIMAVCMKLVSFETITGQDTSNGIRNPIPTSPTSTVKKWQDVPTAVGLGTAGQTCKAWLIANSSNIPSTFDYSDHLSAGIADGAGNWVTYGVPTQGLCAYKTVVSGTTYCSMSGFENALIQTIGGSVQSYAPVKTCTGTFLPGQGQPSTQTFTTKMLY